MNKLDLIQKIKALDGLSQDERAYLINLVNIKKKYGLVWEDKTEAVEEQLREQLPLLREAPEKAILNGDEHPNGTTLHAMMQLNAEDGGKRRCILVTNNENNICEEVTYKHNALHAFIQGERSKGVKLLGGVIVPKEENVWKYCDNPITSAYDLTGWVSFDPALENV